MGVLQNVRHSLDAVRLLATPVCLLTVVAARVGALDLCVLSLPSSTTILEPDLKDELKYVIHEIIVHVLATRK